MTRSSQTKIPTGRPGMLVAIGGVIPMAGIGQAHAEAGHPQPIVDGHGSIPTAAIVVAALTLLAFAVAGLAGRMRWRLGVLALILCGALLGAGTIIDGIQMAIAVSR